jgi:hypothetical protein
MNFLELKRLITEFSMDSRDFLKTTSTLYGEIFKLSRKELLALLKEIGAIPEYINTRFNRREIVFKSYRYIVGKIFTRTWN